MRDSEVTDQVRPFATYYGGHCVVFPAYGTVPEVFRANGENLYFQGTDAGGIGVWISDGTVAGSRLLASSTVFRVGSDTQYVGRILPAAGGALFVMQSYCDYYYSPRAPVVPLWWTDDRGNSQMLLGDNEVRVVALAGDRAFVGAIAADRAAALWTADLTTLQVRRVAPFASIDGVLALPEGGAFVAGRRTDDPSTLWYSNGTAEGTLGLGSPNGWGPGTFVAVGRRAFLLWGRELWTSDGTPAGTGPVPGPTITNRSWLSGLSELEGRLAFFLVPDTAEPAAELWITDGTTNARRVAAFTLPRATSYPGVGNPSILFEGKLHFGIGNILWRSDGTPAGTGPVADLTPRAGAPATAGSSSLSHFATLRGTLFVVASGAEVWRLDGSVAQRVGIDPDVLSISGLAATPSRINYAASFSGGQFATLRALTCED